MDNPLLILPAFGSQPLHERVGWKRGWLPSTVDLRPRWIYKWVDGDALQVAAEIWEEVDVQNKLIQAQNNETGTEIPLLRLGEVDPDSDPEGEVEPEIPVLVGGNYRTSSTRTRYLVWDFVYEAWTVFPFHTTASDVHLRYLKRIHNSRANIDIGKMEQVADYHAYMRKVLPVLASRMTLKRPLPCV